MLCNYFKRALCVRRLSDSRQYQGKRYCLDESQNINITSINITAVSCYVLMFLQFYLNKIKKVFTSYLLRSLQAYSMIFVDLLFFLWFSIFFFSVTNVYIPILNSCIHLCGTHLSKSYKIMCLLILIMVLFLLLFYV